MVVLTFLYGSPNASMEIGDLIYYTPSNVNTFEFAGQGTGTTDSNGVSDYIFLGPISSIQLSSDNFNNWLPTGDAMLGGSTVDGDNPFDVYEPNGGETDFSFTFEETSNLLPTVTESGESALWAFKIYVENPIDIVPPEINDFIFFAKNNQANISSVLGYYNSVTFTNNSNTKAELYSASCTFSESSK